MRVLILVALVMFPFVVSAQVAAIIEINSSRITVYKNHDYGPEVGSFKTNEIKLPAAQLSNPSDFGLIQVELRFNDSSKTPVVGWIKRGSVEVDTKMDVDVISDCGKKSLAAGGSNAHGTRALGGC